MNLFYVHLIIRPTKEPRREKEKFFLLNVICVILVLVLLKTPQGEHNVHKLGKSLEAF